MTEIFDDSNLNDFYDQQSKSELNSINGCYLDTELSIWVPDNVLKQYKKTTKCKNLIWTYLIVQHASSGMSKCRICGYKIEKASLRLGRPIKDPRGDWGIITSWQHLSCSRKLLHKSISYIQNQSSIKSDNDTTQFYNSVESEICSISSSTSLEKDITSEGIKNNSIKQEPHFNLKKESKVVKENINLSPKRKILQHYNLNIPLNFDFKNMIYGLENLSSKELECVKALTLPPSVDDIEKEIFQALELKDLVKKQLTKEYTPPNELLITLLPFQKEGLAWMCHQEESEVKGGILADEMGMGKTIQMISLFLSRKLNKSSRNSKGQLIGANLVIAPLAAILQWKQEIERFTKEKSLKTLIYHGNYRDSFYSEIANYDIIITTYSTLEADYRRVVNKQKIKCQYCKRLFLPEKLRFHQAYYCGPEAEKTAKQNLQKAKSKRAAQKAMKTLNISDTSSFPNPSNVFREILAEAETTHYTQKTSSKTTSDKEKLTEKDKKEIINSLSNLKFDDQKCQNTLKELEKYPKSFILNYIENLKSMLELQTKISHQAHNLSITDIKKLKVTELRSYLKNFGLKTDGIRSELSSRLLDYLYATHNKENEIENINPDNFNGKTEKLISITKNKKSDTNFSIKNSSKNNNAKNTNSHKRKRIFSENSKDNLSDYSYYTSDEDFLLSDYSEISSSSEDSEKENKPRSVRSFSKSVNHKNELKNNKKRFSNSSSQFLTELETKNFSNFGNLELSSSPLHNIKWQRIVLDEAHRIKSRITSTAQAVYSLKSSGTKWCLTGTPLQNRVGELYSLVRFLEFDPFAFYFCSKKGCDCKSLDYKFYDNRFCVICGHSKMSHFSYFNRKIIKPIQNYGYQGEGRNAFLSLKREVLDIMLLRRTKEERAADVNLPKLTVIIRKDSLSNEERDFYESLYKQSKIEFDTYIEAGTLLHNFAHIFELLSLLRQAVDHPYLISHKKKQTQDSKDSELTLCGLCQEFAYFKEIIRTRCKHSFHHVCLQEYIDAAPTNLENQELGCPICYRPLTTELKTIDDLISLDSNEKEESELDTLFSKDKDEKFSTRHNNPTSHKQKLKSIMENIDPDLFKSSTKIEALYQELKNLQSIDSTMKSIVFSQYSFMLEIIEWRLKKGGINCAKFVGSMSLVSRSNILYAFNRDADLKVLLISLKAGGEGLNLQIANNIFLMDPWWNPASEMQAIQRAHRIGQKKPVRAVRFICKDTIEEKILQLQEKKQLVFDGTIGAQSQAIMKLTSEDMKFLFQN